MGKEVVNATVSKSTEYALMSFQLHLTTTPLAPSLPPPRPVLHCCSSVRCWETVITFDVAPTSAPGGPSRGPLICIISATRRLSSLDARNCPEKRRPYITSLKKAKKIVPFGGLRCSRFVPLVRHSPIYTTNLKSATKPPCCSIRSRSTIGFRWRCLRDKCGFISYISYT